jgi:hypothetical protein
LPATDIGQGAWADQAQASFARVCRLAALVAVSAAIGAGGRVRLIPADESWPVREVKSILKDG